MSRRRWSVLAFAVAMLTALVLAFAPWGEKTCTSTIGSVPTCGTTHESLLHHEGASVLLVLAAPVVLTAVPLVWPARRVRMAVAIVLNILVVLGALSIGVFFVPVLVLAWIAATRPAGGA